MRFRDLATGRDADDVLERTYYGTAWSTDEEHLFYVVPDEAMRPVPGVAPPAGHAAGRRRAGAPGGRRAVLPGRRAEPQRAGRAADQREQDLGRDLLHPRRRARGRAGGRRAAGSRPRVQRRPPGRPLRHPHQPRRRGLPCRDRACGRAGPSRLDRPRAARARPPDHQRRRLRRLRGAPRVARRHAPPARAVRRRPRARRPPSRRRCTRSTSATTPSTGPTPCAWSTSPS